MNESFETKLFNSFKRHFVILLIVSLAVGAGAGLYRAKTCVPLHKAKSTILIINNNKKPKSLSRLKRNRMLVDLYASLVNTTSVIDVVKEKTRIKGYKYSELKDTMLVEQKVQAIDISVEDKNASNAIKIVNAIVEAVDEQGKKIVGEDTVATVDKANGTENLNPPAIHKYFMVGLMGGLIVLTLLCYLFDSIKQTKRGEK